MNVGIILSLHVVIPLVLPGLRQRLFKVFVLTKGAKIVID